MTRLGPAGLLLTLALGAATTAGAETMRQATPAPDPCLAPASRGEPDPVASLGCATETNLRAMIADPADLVRGAAPSPPAGDAAFAAAHRHRLGQTKHFDAGGSGSSSGSGGGYQPNSASR